MKKHYATVMTIAGSDCSGGAGIQADLKSIAANGGYAATVITALTAQNTQGVYAIAPVTVEFVEAQLRAVLSDLSIDTVKIGMVYSDEIINCILAQLQRYNFSHIVVDPVMVAKGGKNLIKNNTISLPHDKLLSLSTLITPNIREAENLSNIAITSKFTMIESGQCIAEKYKTNVLVKGGHLDRICSDDLLYLFSKRSFKWFAAKRVDTLNTHGTGCSLSSAIALFLSKGFDLLSSVQKAKDYVYSAILSGKDFHLGKGHGPINHFYKRGFNDEL